MNLIYGETGGRPRSIDDLYLIQSEAYKALTAPYRHIEDAKGGFIVTGCTPSGITNTISAGIIFLGGEFLEFDGATNVTFPAKFGVVETLNTSLQYEDGNNKNTRRLRAASIDPTVADYTHSFTITPGSYQELADLLMHKFGDEGIYGNKSFRDNIIVKGINVYDKLISLGNDITSALNTLTQNLNNAVTSLTNQLNAKADKQQLTWVDVPLAANWMCYPTEKLQCAKDQFGMVYVRGTINPINSVGTGSNILGTMATLPAGYRPVNTQQYVIWQSGNMFGAININSDGSIEGYNPQSYPYPRFVVDYKQFSLN